jgi:hypothetical protein
MEPGPGRSKGIARLLSLGTIGAAALLGSAISAHAATTRPATTDDADVAGGLTAIQEATLAVEPPDLIGGAADNNVRLVWGHRWFNSPRGGWGNFRPRWHNFRPRWNNFWRNW